MTSHRTGLYWSIVVSLLYLTLIAACGGGGGGSSSGTTSGDSQVVIPKTSIGTNGGTLEVTDPSSPLYGFKLTIPENAMSQATNIEIAMSDRSLALPEGLTGNGIVISIESNVRKFSTPVSMTIPYNVEGGDVPTVISYDDSTGSYSILPIVGIDSTNGTITILTSHFTLFQMVKVGSMVPVQSQFNIPEDAFNITNTTNNIAGTDASAGGACYGFAAYSKWYFENKKSSDGILQNRYCSNEKYVVSDAWALQSRNIQDWRDKFIYRMAYLLDQKANATAFASLRSSMIFKTSDGRNRPQVLGLCQGLICDHAVLATGISYKQDSLGPYAEIQIYDNVVSDKQGIIKYYYLSDGDSLNYKWENTGGLGSWSHILYMGDGTLFSDDDGMLAIYNKYKNTDCSQPLSPPSTPAGFTVTAASSSQTDLSWTASTGTVTGYRVYRSGSLLKTVLSPSTSTSDTGLSPSTNYCYYVIAYNSAGESAQTSQLCATTQTPPSSMPSTPTGFTVTASSSSQIDLVWTAPTGTVTGYKVYKGGTYLKSVTATTTSDTGLSPSTNYCYYVIAYNSAGQSEQTSQICATTKAPPSTSTGLIGTWNRIAVTGNYSTNLAVQITFISITAEGYDAIVGNCSWKTSAGAINSGPFIYYKDPLHITGPTLTSVISGLEGANLPVTWVDNNTIIISWGSGNSKWTRQ